ncbi:MAG: serine hydrolase [Candidatus Pacebacteria bacterium]|nr:serine hydrolase [Candidatus Paceibacterota bacterium]MCF7857100.1 serine hydrolase [Candidatus Paceibacterota bacterium]
MSNIPENIKDESLLIPNESQESVDGTNPELPTTEEPAHATSPIPVLPQLSVALGVLVFVFGVTYIGAAKTLSKNPNTNEMRIETTLSDTSKNLAIATNFFDAVTLEAKSAFVWDVQTQRVLFNKNADDIHPLASVTKLMTALVAYELLDPTDKVKISQRSLRTEGDSGFVDGEEFSMRNLVDLTLISSSNDGAVALSEKIGATVVRSQDPEKVFVEAMNLRATELGLTNTRFLNSSGLDISKSEAGAYGTARDIALLMEYIITKSADVTELTTTDITTISNNSGEYHIVKNTNDVVNGIDGLIASKTGYTVLAGGNLVVAFDAGFNRPIVIAILGSSQNGRFNDILKLVNSARQTINN